MEKVPPRHPPLRLALFSCADHGADASSKQREASPRDILVLWSHPKSHALHAAVGCSRGRRVEPRGWSGTVSECRARVVLRRKLGCKGTKGSKNNVMALPQPNHATSLCLRSRRHTLIPHTTPSQPQGRRGGTGWWRLVQACPRERPSAHPAAAAAVVEVNDSSGGSNTKKAKAAPFSPAGQDWNTRTGPCARLERG